LAETILTWKQTDPITRKINLFQILFAAAILFFIGFSAMVDNWAHLGGFLCGFFLGLGFFQVDQHRKILKFLPFIFVALYNTLFLILIFTIRKNN